MQAPVRIELSGSYQRILRSTPSSEAGRRGSSDLLTDTMKDNDNSSMDSVRDRFGTVHR